MDISLKVYQGATKRRSASLALRKALIRSGLWLHIHKRLYVRQRGTRGPRSRRTWSLARGPGGESQRVRQQRPASSRTEMETHARTCTHTFPERPHVCQLMNGEWHEVQATHGVSEERGADPPWGRAGHGTSRGLTAFLGTAGKRPILDGKWTSQGQEETATRTAPFWGDENVPPRTAATAAQIRNAPRATKLHALNVTSNE